jgi:nucleoside-diphosphate-sugar epimerase
MNILLTGAHGFTGRYFQEIARNRGHVVIALQADLTDVAALRREVAELQPHAVVHLAAISFVAHTDQSALYAVNAVGTTNLLSALSALPNMLDKVLLASSANVYGNCAVSPIAETQMVTPVNHYATSKLAMECMARTYMSRLPIVITRPFNYTGAGQSPQFVIPKLVSHYARRLPLVELGNLNVEREFNDVRMVCGAYLALLDHGVPGEVYNVCSGLPHTLQEVITILAGLSGHKVEVRVNPAFARVNEVRRLCGDGTKLRHLCDVNGIVLKQANLREMLRWMLAEASV